MKRAAKESDFQKRITDLATLHGWSWWHIPAPMRRIAGGDLVGAREAAGLPDLILLHDDPPRLVFMEIKREGGKLSEKQQEFLQAAKKVADRSIDNDRDWYALSDGRTVGVMAVWPKDEPLVEQMLKSRVVA